MKNLFYLIAAAFLMQGCAMPSVSTAVIEADAAKGNLMQISGLDCGMLCHGMALTAAQQVCPKGYSIQNTTPAYRTDINMIVRCQPETPK